MAKLNSTIFKTENDNLTIFGKTLDDVKEKWNDFLKAYNKEGLFGENGAFSTLFSGKSNGVTDELLGDAEAFKDLFNESSVSAKVLAEDLGGVDEKIVAYAKTCKNGEFTMEEFKASLEGVTLKAKAGQIALKGLAIAGNLVASFLISKGIEWAISAVDNYIHKVEKANEKIDESRSAYDEATSNIESMNDELAVTQDKIDELQSKGTLSFTDKAELENLKEQNTELERSISLEEKKKKIAAEQTVADIKQEKDTLFDDFNDSMSTFSSYQDEYNSTKETGLKGISDGTVELENYEATMTAMDKTMAQYEENIIENIEKFEQYKEDIVNKYGSDDISKFSQSDRDLYNNIVSQLQEAYALIYSDDEYNKFVIKPIFDTSEFEGLEDQLLQYFVRGGSTDITALESKFGSNIITALRNACEKAGIDFDKMIEDIYNNSQSKLDQIAPIPKTPNSAEDAKQYNAAMQLRDYIQNDLSEEEFQIALTISSEEFNKAIEEEKKKVETELQSLSKEGNVDLTIRPVVDSSTMQAAGWDVEDGSIATTFTQGEFIWQGDEENGQYVYVHYTPILPDGTVLTPEELTDYLYGTLEGSEDILGSDDKGLVLKVDTDFNIPEEDIEKLQNGEGSTKAIDDFIQKTGEWDDKVHSVQEQYYDTGEGIGYVKTALDGLIAKHSELEKDNETTISFTEQISQVQKLSEGLDQLDKIYADVYDKEDFDYSSIVNNADFTSTFGNLANVTDEYKDAYDEFIQTVSNSPNDIESCQEAFNKLATAYIYNSGCLDNLTEETRASSIAMLEQMGITNAEEIVDNRLLTLKSSLAAAQESLNIAKQNGLNSSIDLENATLSEIDALIQEYDQYGLDTEALYNYMCQKIQANNEVIATNGDITALQNLCTQLGVASGAIEKYARIKARISEVSKMEASEGVKQSDIDRTLSGLEAEAAQLEKEMQNAVVNYKPEANYNGAKKTKEAKKSSGSNKSSNNDKKETEKDYDWIETKISRIQRNISNLGKTVSATYKSWSARNNALLQEINAVNSEISTQQAAYNKYMQLANSVGLDEGYANLIRNGALDVSTVTDEALSDKIEKYKSFYEKAIQCSDAIIDLKNNLADLAKTRFD